MANQKTVLAAEARAKAGKGAARAIRRTGNVPAVIYGDNKEPVLISLSEKELTLAMRKKGFYTHLIDLSVDKDQHLVIARDVQVHPVSDRPEHVDFLRVSDKTVISVDVPVRVINEKSCPGLVKGGVLNVVHHEISVYCKATDIPEEFTVDLDGLDVGDNVHVSQLNLPAGVETVQTGDFTVITLVAPSALKSEEDAAAAAEGAEGEAAEGAEGEKAEAAEGEEEAKK
ncbi:MAG: 50S ribosomal protein L25/general stress protein Ctc [Alphaproteobacteria bacterium]|nr:50S ribosomal protein L25/general stress protein Ctc [Alphaproteobacteria bacterium]